MICWRSWSARRRTSSRSNSVDSDQPVNFDQFIATPRAASYKTSGPIVQPAEESVGKISLCTSQCSPCLRGASFLKQFQHGDTETTESTRRSSIFPTDCFSRVIGGVSQEKGSRLNGFHLSLAQFTWLKPGVNETGSIQEFDSPRCPNDFLCKAS